MTHDMEAYAEPISTNYRKEGSNGII